eukprot:9469672-Pyramimonas_sp.AAC.2
MPSCSAQDGQPKPLCCRPDGWTLNQSRAYFLLDRPDPWPNHEAAAARAKQIVPPPPPPLKKAADVAAPATAAAEVADADLSNMSADMLGEVAAVIAAAQ